MHSFFPSIESPQCVVWLVGCRFVHAFWSPEARGETLWRFPDIKTIYILQYSLLPTSKRIITVVCHFGQCPTPRCLAGWLPAHLAACAFSHLQCSLSQGILSNSAVFDSAAPTVAGGGGRQTLQGATWEWENEIF